MSHQQSKIKRDKSRVWNRATFTGFIRPQRKFHRAKWKLFRQLQKQLRKQMEENLAAAVPETGMVQTGPPENLEVKEIQWDPK